MRKIQAAYTKYPYTIACIGDSLAHSYATNVNTYEHFYAVLQGLLNALDCYVQARSFGNSGDTTTQMLARIG